jgi:hypothetical protein
VIALQWCVDAGTVKKHSAQASRGKGSREAGSTGLHATCGLCVGPSFLTNIGHQSSGHPTFPATRVDAFLVPPLLINPPSFDQLPFPLL